MAAQKEELPVQPVPIDIEKNSANEKSNLKHTQSQSKETTYNASAAFDEAFLVTYSPGDPENPLNWSTKLKWGITAAVSGTGFVRIMVSTVRLSAPPTFAANELGYR